MGKTFRHERMEKRPRQVERKVPKKVRIEDFVQTPEEELDEEQFPEYEEDTCSTYLSIRS